jgi:hypothetical protein
MPEYDHLPIDGSLSVSGLKNGDPLLKALKREHGPQPRYDYPPKLVRYYKLDHAETNKA